MNGPKSSPPNDAVERVREGGLVSPGRRRFAKGAAPVLLGTLASKPVLGAQYVCTVSGHASGNVSAPTGDDADCEVGNDLAYWLNSNNSWPDGFRRGDQNPQCWPTGNATLFNGYPGAGAPTLESTFFVQKVSGVCSLGTQGVAASMLQVLSLTGEDELSRLGRATVISLLNAAQLGSTYPVTRARIISMFNAVRGGGTYHVEGANLNLSRLGVIAYLEKLYS